MPNILLVFSILLVISSCSSRGIYQSEKKSKLVQLYKGNTILKGFSTMQVDLKILKWYEKEKECIQIGTSINCQIFTGKKLH